MLGEYQQTTVKCVDFHARLVGTFARVCTAKGSFFCTHTIFSYFVLNLKYFYAVSFPILYYRECVTNSIAFVVPFKKII